MQSRRSLLKTLGVLTALSAVPAGYLITTPATTRWFRWASNDEMLAYYEKLSETGPEVSLDEGSQLAAYLLTLDDDELIRLARELCSYNAVNRQISPLDEDDTRPLAVQHLLLDRVRTIMANKEQSV